MAALLRRIFGRQPAYRPGPPPQPRLVLAQACADAFAACVAPETRRGHEGVAYLLGQTDGSTTLALAAMRPEALTTRGSFAVDARAMAKIVRTASAAGLQVVGQLHTHPGEAYHSEGDDDGARIAYTGYVSIVLPEYGRLLPALTGAAIYVFRAGTGFIPVEASRVAVIGGRIE